MKTADRDLIAREICSGRCVLFAGAGLGQQCGLPGWETALTQLAAIIERDDPAIGAAMKARLAEGLLLDAADLFQLSKLTRQSRLEALIQVFDQKPGENSHVKELLDLPFRAFVTTNYDAIIENTVATVRKEALTPFRNVDSDLRAAMHCRSRYLAHIHRVIKIPESLVLSRADYARTMAMEAYNNFLRHVLRDYTVLFFGFSFRDPALALVLEYIGTNMALPGDGPTLALVSPSEKDLHQKLREVGVKPIMYAEKGDHSELWNAVRAVATEARRRCGDGPEHPEAGFEREREVVMHSLAAVYAHFQVQREEPALASVVSGITLSALVDAVQDNRCDVGVVEKRIAKVFYLSESEAHNFVARGLDGLQAAGTISRENTFVHLLRPPHEQVAETETLVSRLRSRAQVRYNTALPKDADLRSFLLRVLVTNGLSVAHSIVRQRPVESLGVDVVASQACDAVFGTDRPTWRPALIATTRSLLVSPTPDEAQALASFARLVMLTDVVLNSPSLEGLTGAAHVSKIYLDANVLMPAILTHHPRHAPYRQTIEGARNGGARVAVNAAFVNEAVSHRYGALVAYEAGGFADFKVFERYVRLFGSDGINAYLGSFAGWRASGQKGGFETFLREWAPYSTEAELTKYLRERGFEVVDLAFDSAIELGRIARWEAALRDRYEMHRQAKARTLIWHEARQMEALLLARGASVAAWFVTNDRKFVKAVAAIAEEGHLLPPDIVQRILTPVQAAAYVDISSERRMDWPGYAQLLWSAGHQEFDERVREYTTDRVLDQYEAALTMSIPTLLEACRKELATKGAFDDSQETAAGEDIRLKQFRLLEQFEPRFYELMLEEKRRHGLA